MDASTRVQEPANGSKADIVVGWLRFHRDALANNATGLTAEQLTATAAPPSAMTILGLVRHITEMERVYGAWAIGGTGDLAFVYGDYVDDGPEWDFEFDPSMVEGSLANRYHERDATDRAFAPPARSIRSGRQRVQRAAEPAQARRRVHPSPATPTSCANGSTARPASDPAANPIWVPIRIPRLNIPVRRVRDRRNDVALLAASGAR